MMYLPAWQGLGFAEWVGRTGEKALPFPLNEPNTTSFHTARSAIYHVFSKLVQTGRRVVLAPDYHMGNEIRAMRHAGAQIVWYPVTRRFTFDVDQVRRLCRQHEAHVLFVIHYAGWPQPAADLRALCAELDVVLVEDCALAMLTDIDGRPAGSYGDYAVFCLYKTLPLPDGGMLVQNRRVFDDLVHMPLDSGGRMFAAGRLAELTFERLRSRYERPGRWLAQTKQRIGGVLTALRVERVPVGDTGFNRAHVNIGMASSSARLLRKLNYEHIRTRRRHNFLFLQERLPRHGSVCADLPPGTCPLFFPFLVKHKARAARALWARGVMATELWNEGDDSAAGCEGEDSRFLRRHVLELPIHQDITDAQLSYMARQVEELDLTLPAHQSAPVRVQPITIRSGT